MSTYWEASVKVIARRGPELTLAEPCRLGNRIRLFERRQDGWYECITHSPFPDAPDWMKVPEWLAPRLSRLEALPPQGRAGHAH